MTPRIKSKRSTEKLADLMHSITLLDFTRNDTHSVSTTWSSPISSRRNSDSYSVSSLGSSNRQSVASTLSNVSLHYYVDENNYLIPLASRRPCSVVSSLPSIHEDSEYLEEGCRGPRCSPVPTRMDSLDSAGNLFRAAAGVVVGDIPTVVRRKASSDSGLSARPLPEMSREEREERELRMKAMREEYLMQREGVYLGSPNACPIQKWEADGKESDSVPKTKKTNFMWFGKSRSGRSSPDSM